MSDTKVKGSVGAFFDLLRTLTVMQLKEKINLTFLKSKRQTIFKIAWLFIEFVAITAICFLLFFACKLLGVFSLVGDIPDTVINVVFTVMMGLSLIFGTMGLVKSLYFSRDNLVLLTYPVTPTCVFLSKLAVYYIYEFRKNFMFMFPLFIAYGLVKKMPVLYYPWLILMFLFISAVPVILSALLSIPSMYVYAFIRKHKFLQYAIYAVLAGAAIVLVVWLIGKIPTNIDLAATWGDTFYDIQKFLKGFAEALPVMYAWTQLIVGKSSAISNTLFTATTLPHLLILIAASAVLLALCFVTSRPLFYKMASKPFEYAKKANPRAEKNRQRGGFLSALRKETVIGLRSNDLITSGFVLLVILPIAVELQNKLYAAMNTRLVGTQMTLSFSMLIMLLIMLSCNVSLASGYSRDGSASYLNKIQPTDYIGLLFAKIVPNLVLSLIGTAEATIVFSRFVSLSPADVIFFGATLFFTAAAHAFWSAEMDIMNPQYEQYATFSDQTNNPNENMSALLVFILGILMFAITFFLGMDNTASVWIKVFFIALALAAVKVATFFLKVKTFYKEK